jgi:hypothetical protein
MNEKDDTIVCIVLTDDLKPLIAKVRTIDKMVSPFSDQKSSKAQKIHSTNLENT